MDRNVFLYTGRKIDFQKYFVAGSRAEKARGCFSSNLVSFIFELQFQLRDVPVVHC